QGIADAQPFSGRAIDSISIRITNPLADSAFNSRVEDGVRRALRLFPGSSYSDEQVTLALGAAKRIAGIAALDHETLPSAAGGVDLAILITLRDDTQPDAGRGMALTGDWRDFPILLDRDGTYLRFKLDAFSLYYGNDNAWYGRPDLMLAGNPLLQGKAAGRGYDDWAEAYLHYGVYGITPLGEGLSFYGGLSAMTTWSQGQELFTDKTRSHTQVEDAYLGIVGGHVDGRGNRLVFNLTAGRQRFTLANGFLIANTAANGGERAALQANARWSSDLLVLGQIAYNDVKLEAFYLDPDELPLLDTGTRIGGVNLETTPLRGLSLGASYLTVPKSGANYFGPDGSVAGGREGLRVHDLRLAYQLNPAGASGPFFGAEIARQTNRNFDMDARAGWAELGYHFADARWSPTISYRVSYFSGDDPATSAYERWDPLLSGGTGEQWVQGANHFKVVQDSNVIAHRIQARFKVTPRIEVVPQLWAFRADQLNNIGGNPALSVLSDDELGYEANVTVKWFKSKNTYIHGHVAYTVPGSAAKAALGGSAKDWLSVMAFVRYAF
ncbi:alginate export family protein, partial [Paracoccus sp. MKU1]|uniref:alginate export family protein n=1 Tax=Paracoccus sp. MKU1 TaxID=1745182 RepID=UPI0007190FCE